MQINVIEYFAKGVLLKCRDKVAIIKQSARYTFAEIERFAKNCAALILKRNAAVKRPVAGFLPKSARAIIADLGILYKGNCYANLDAKSPPERLKSLLQNLGASSSSSTSASHAATLRALGVPDDQLLLVDQGLLRVSPPGMVPSGASVNGQPANCILNCSENRRTTSLRSHFSPNAQTRLLPPTTWWRLRNN
jgi:hypothetical protein